jgi:GNAT superfamily N-acetyltransferase
MVKIAIVNPADWMPKIKQLMDDNWAETGFDFDFVPNIEMYEHMFKNNVIFAVAALNDDDVVGYCTVAITPHPYNQSILMAGNDALFVSPPYRNGTLTGRLMKKAESESRLRGAKRFFWHCRAGTRFADVLVNHGYKPVDIVVMKEI